MKRPGIIVGQPIEATWFVEGDRCVLELRRGRKVERYDMPPQIAVAIANNGIAAARQAQGAVNRRKARG